MSTDMHSADISLKHAYANPLCSSPVLEYASVVQCSVLPCAAFLLATKTPMDYSDVVGAIDYCLAVTNKKSIESQIS